MNVFDSLGGQKLLNDTLIIRTADHGDMFMAHGGQRQKVGNYNLCVLICPSDLDL
jgi:arylsulfatase A-like enzyme